MKNNLGIKLILPVLGICLVAAVYIGFVIKVGQVPDIPEIITCDERYIGDSYQGEIKRKDGDYIYLSGYHSINTICAIDENDVDDEYPLCGTKVPFEGPLDTSNMNCYYDNPKSKLKAFKKRMEDEKKEDERYYTCDIDSSYVIKLYNDCETVACAQNRLRTYFQEKCPRANVD